MSTDTAWVQDADTFSARLALVRNRMQWNVREAAIACDLAPSSWKNWELGKRPHDLDEVCRKIAKRSGCDYVWLALGPHADEALSMQCAFPADLLVLAS